MKYSSSSMQKEQQQKKVINVRNSFIITMRCVLTAAMKSERPLERKLQVISGQTVKKTKEDTMNPHQKKKISIYRL